MSLTLAELEQQLRELDAKASDIEAADEVAAFNLLLKPDDRKVKQARTDAERDLKAHHSQRLELMKGINAARRREGAAEADRKAKARKTAWDRVLEKHEPELTAAFADVEKSDEQLVAAIERAIEAGRAIQQDCPVELPDGGLHGFLLGEDAIFQAVRADTYRVGSRVFVGYWPEPRHEIPTLTARRERLRELLKTLRDKDLAANAAAAE
jgi:hypothetical protein